MADFFAMMPGPIHLRLDLSDLRLSEVLHNLIYGKGARSGVPRVVAVDHNDVRELAGTLLIEADTKDAAIAQLAAINTLFRTGTTLILRSRGATRSVTLTVLPSPRAVPPFDDGLWEADSVKVAGRVPFLLKCEQYARRSELTLVNAASITAPCIVDLPGLTGDYATPLQVTLAGAGGAKVRAVYLAILRDTANPIGAYVREGEARTWTGGTAVTASSSNARGGSYVRNDVLNAPLYAAVTDTDLPAGTHIALMRGLLTGTGTYRIMDPLTGAEPCQKTFAGVGSAWHLFETGSLKLPVRKVRGSGASSHSIGFGATVSGQASLDYYAMVPTRCGWARYAPPPGSAADQASLTFDYDHLVYDEGGVAVSALLGHSGGLLAQPGDRLLVVGIADSPTGGTLGATCTVKAIPRHALWA
jgi:hypothetical protein